MSHQGSSNSPVLCARGLSVHRGTCRIIDGLELQLRAGWTGLVGENGAGKSSLLRVFAGLDAPVAGHISSTGVVAYCEQVPTTVPDQVERFAESWDADAMRWRGRLDCVPGGPSRWHELSSGERRRWQLASLLYLEPDVLLVDEPSDHLDADARALLIDALAQHRGVGVLVSHDRALLTALTTRTLFLENARIVDLALPYDEAFRSREDTRQAHEKHALQRRRELDRAERRQEAAQRQRDAADRGRSVRKRMKGPQDSDGREAGRKGRADKAAAQAAKAAARAREATRRERERTEFVVTKRAPRLRAIGQTGQRATWVAATLDTPDGQTLVSDLSMTLDPRERLWITGANGAGKSTLLRALATAWTDAVLLPQELPSGAEPFPLDLDQMSRSLRERYVHTAAALGASYALACAPGNASAGERRKLVSASVLCRPTSTLLLDEPTNHLDLPAIERLERALEEYEGSIIVVSHDDVFARNVCERRLHLDRDAMSLTAHALGG